MKKNILFVILGAMIALLVAVFINLNSNTVDNKKALNVNLSNWKYYLVNENNPITSEITFKKASIAGTGGSTIKVDSRIKKPLQNLLNAASKAGYKVSLISGYQSLASQDATYNQALQKASLKEAVTDLAGMQKIIEKVRKEIINPGANEYPTGLAVDMATVAALDKYPNLSTKIADTKSQQWLIKNAPNYGFIVRQKNQPWHFRYVGINSARYITNNDLTLEEYIGRVQQEEKKK
ncbi:MAG: M15 family metallopeptidase [Lactobacillaceae bacterium]|jgi:D-alanyl-D-alanine carboxypeptidase|nr:M15 family metallopeptidase [Lactobacillaceae bacterium]